MLLTKKKKLDVVVFVFVSRLIQGHDLFIHVPEDHEIPLDLTSVIYTSGLLQTTDMF